MPWGKLLRLLGQLRSTSRYIAAQRNDDEYVAELAAAGIDFEAESKATSDEEYTPVLRKLDDLQDGIGLLVHLKQQELSRGRAGRFRSTRRPENAIVRYVERARVSRHDSLLSEVEQARSRRKNRTT